MVEQEIELKLSLPETEIARFRRDSLIHRQKRGRALNKPLLAAYFDTPDMKLRARKMAFRIRQEGRARIQTLKVSNSPAAGLQIRGEYNAPTSADVPDLDLISDEGVRSVMTEVIGETGSLVPVFTTDIRRTLWTLEEGANAVEVCLDIGAIVSGGKSVSVCEVELELKSGSVAYLLDIADILAERYGCQVFTDSKAARGYHLFQPREPEVRRATKLLLEPEMSVWEAFQTIMAEGTEQLFGNIPVVRDGNNSDGVHQARVGVRRMRAALSAFQPALTEEFRKPLNRQLRWFAGMLGPARDWDVFIDETLGPVSAAPNPPPGLKKFQARCGEARRRAYRRANKGLNADRFGRIQLSLIRIPYHAAPTKEALGPIGAFAGNLLDERLLTIQTAAGEDPAGLDEISLHALRIDIKKMRYAVEFFGNLYDTADVKSYRSALKKLQECLGGLNDAAVHTAMLQSMDAPDHPVPKSVRRSIETHLSRSQDQGLSSLSAMWAWFSGLTPFWRDPASVEFAGAPEPVKHRAARFKR